jgi:hypothetical protein
MERRQKEKGKYSKMFTVENYTFIQDSKLQTTSIIYILQISQNEGWAFINI